MDWEDTNRPSRENETDGRPRTQEELRSRNARRSQPNLDNGRRESRTARERGETGGRASSSGGDTARQRPRRTRRERAWQDAAPAGRRKTAPARRPRRRSRDPETQVHWSDPKPFDRRAFYWKLAATLAVVLAVLMGFSIFFKVGKITISGMEKYTPEAVLEASGIQRGESLLGLNQNKKANNILSALPYVKEVQIGIKLPDTVNISIVELAVTYAVSDTEGRWWLMDSGCKLVEGVSQTEAQSHTQVAGLVITDPQVGSEITPLENTVPAETVPQTTDETGETAAETTEPDTAPTETAVPGETAAAGSTKTKVEAVREILKALEANNLMGEIRQVDVTFLYSITLQYEDRLEIRLGQPDNLTYKVNYMAQAVAQIADYQIGTLDVTFDGAEEARFIPQETESTEETVPETGTDTASEE